MPRLSIIIPALGRCDLLEETLVSVLTHRPREAEVLVVHDGCYHDAYDLAGEVGFLRLPKGAGLAAGLSAAVAAALGPVLHVLASGASVEDGWCEPALARLDEDDAAAAVPVVVSRNDPRRVLAAGQTHTRGGRPILCGAGLSADSPAILQLAPLGPSLAAAFYRRADVLAAGGFEPAVGDELLGLDLALSLAALGRRSLLVPQVRIACDDKSLILDGGGSIQRGLALERLFWRHAARGGRMSVWAHAADLLWEALGTPLFPSRALLLWGRALGWLGGGGPRPANGGLPQPGDLAGRASRELAVTGSSKLVARNS